MISGKWKLQIARGQQARHVVGRQEKSGESRQKNERRKKQAPPRLFSVTHFLSDPKHASQPPAPSRSNLNSPISNNH